MAFKKQFNVSCDECNHDKVLRATSEINANTQLENSGWKVTVPDTGALYLDPAKSLHVCPKCLESDDGNLEK